MEMLLEFSRNQHDAMNQQSPSDTAAGQLNHSSSHGSKEEKEHLTVQPGTNGGD